MNSKEVNSRIEKCIKTKSKTLDLSGLEIFDLKDVKRLNECIHLEKLNLSSNKISKIENLNQLTQLSQLNLAINKISKIENLDQLTQLLILFLSFNKILKIENLDQLTQLSSLDLYSNKISKIENLDQLTQLSNLYLSINHIPKIENLDQLIKLFYLDLYSNQITKIENLDQLTQLSSLDLHSNQISKIENLDQLTQLSFLYLHSNQVSKIENLTNLLDYNSLNKLVIDRNPFLQNVDIILKEHKNHLDVIKNLLLQFIPSKDNTYEYPVKLVVLGNHAMGKSNLVEYLKSDSITSLEIKSNDKRSTHGLEVIPLTFETKADSFPDAIIYDFGGQDYYHGLYRSYLNYGCNYIIIWKPQASKCLQKKDNTGFDNYYFDLPYWLGQKIYYDSSTHNEGEKGPIFLIQGYADVDSKQQPTLSDAYNHQIRENIHICLNPDQLENNRVELDYLKKKIKDLILLQKQKTNKASWYKKFITHIYTQISIADYNPVEVSSLSHLFKEGDLKTELNQLHNKGLIIYFQDILPDILWLNPCAFNGHVWKQVLPKEKLIQYKGRLPESELAPFSNELLVLKQQKIIFHYEKEGIYLVPNFLEPAPIHDSDYRLLVEDFGKASCVLYFENFVPIPIINQAISYFGKKNDAKFWKNELRFTLENECKVRLYFDIQAFTISIFLAKKGGRGYDKQMVLAYLFHCLLRMYWDIQIIETFEGFSYIRNNIIKYDITHNDPIKFYNTVDKPSIRFKELNNNLESESLQEGDNYSDDSNSYYQVHFKDIISIYTKKNYWIPDLSISIDGKNKISFKELSETIFTNQDLSSYKHFNARSIKDNAVTRVLTSSYQSFVGRPLNKNKAMKNIFICYASEDLKYKNQLIKFLHNPVQQGKIKIWHDHVLNPGDDWDDQIKQNLKGADIVIILVSQDAIISKYINKEEMAITLERHEKDEVKLFPVLVRPSDFIDWEILPKDVAKAADNKEVKIGKFQFFPKVDGKLKALSTMSEAEQEETWLELKKVLMKMIG